MFTAVQTNAFADVADPMLSEDLTHADCNAAARVGIAFADFLVQCARDTAHAEQNGLELVNAYTSPNGREGDGSKRVKTFPVHIDRDELRARVRRLLTMARLGGVCRNDADALAKCERATRAALASLANIDRDAWDAWTRSEKAHLSGPEAAALDVDGFAWTASEKGHATTVRYDETAQRYLHASKSDAAYVNVARVSEGGML